MELTDDESVWEWEGKGKEGGRGAKGGWGFFVKAKSCLLCCYVPTLSPALLGGKGQGQDVRIGWLVSGRCLDGREGKINLNSYPYYAIFLTISMMHSLWIM